MNKYILVILFTIISFVSFSQSKKLYRTAEKQIKNWQWEKAKHTLFKIYATGNIDYTLLSHIADCYQSLDNLDSAWLFYERAMTYEQANQNATFQSNIALMYLKRSDIAKGIQHLSNAITLSGKADYYLYRGLVYYHINEFDKACSDLKLAMELGNEWFYDESLLSTNCSDFPTEEQVASINKIQYRYSVVMPAKN